MSKAAMRIGFIGAGKVAQAMTKGLLLSGKYQSNQIIASAPKTKVDSLFLDSISELGIDTTHSNNDVMKFSDVVILAVKPNVMPIILPEIASAVAKKHFILSFSLGCTLNFIEKALPQHTRVARVMPNISMQIGKGTSVYCLGNSVKPSDPKLLVSLLGSVGMVEELEDESLMDSVTALSGSGPAYTFMFLESLVDGAVMMGLSRAQATRLAAYTLIGAAQMCLKAHPSDSINAGLGALKGDVCSPGGCTARSVYILEKMGFRASLIAAIEASTLRSAEINESYMKLLESASSSNPWSRPHSSQMASLLVDESENGTNGINSKNDSDFLSKKQDIRVTLQKFINTENESNLPSDVVDTPANATFESRKL